MSPTAEPISIAIGPVEIALAVDADLDDVLDILKESARWLASRGINQWRVDGFPRELIAADISRGEVYVARRDRRAVGTFTLLWSDELFWPGATDEACYIHRIAVRREARGLGVELLKFAERATAATGRKLLRLDCFSGNAALCGYYERAGFVRRADVEVNGRATRRCPNLQAVSSRVSTKNRCTDSIPAARAAPRRFVLFPKLVSS